MFTLVNIKVRRILHKINIENKLKKLLIMEQKKDYYRPLAFFLLVINLTWIPWLAAVAIGKDVNSLLIKALIFTGGVGPTLSALILLYTSKNKVLQNDYWQRVFNIKLIKPKGYLFIFLLAPILASISVVISTFFGKSFLQFQLVDHLQKNLVMIFPFILFIFFFGPVPEEFGWRGYWLDSLRTKFNGLSASIIIGCVWAAWHLPLFFVKGYPLSEYTHDSLKMFVYITDLIPKAIIYTFVFYSNSRSTLAAILFHFMGNFTGSIIEIDPITEFIQMILLYTVAAILILRNKDIYLHKCTFQIKQGIVRFINDGVTND